MIQHLVARVVTKMEEDLIEINHMRLRKESKEFTHSLTETFLKQKAHLPSVAIHLRRCQKTSKVKKDKRNSAEVTTRSFSDANDSNHPLESASGNSFFPKLQILNYLIY